MRLKFIGRGTYYRQIVRALGENRIAQSHTVVNWGLQGDNLRDYEARYPAIRRKPTLNERQFGNKYDCVEAARANGLPVPESITHPYGSMRGDWIIKPYYSLGGRDIRRYERGSAVPNTHYLQKDLSSTRRYEVRVHAMAWVPPEQWIIQKRVHEDGETQLTWNHHTGGTFITVNDTTDPLFVRIKETTAALMRTLGYQFGAADFIVCNAGERGRPLPHYFIEWNLAPGWTLDHIRDYYISAFRALSRMDTDDVTMMLEGGLLNGAPELQITTTQDAPPQQAERPLTPEEREPNAGDRRASIRQQVNTTNETARVVRRAPQVETPVEVVASRVVEQDDSARYAAAMADMADAQAELNFCPECGRSITSGMFSTPKFCTSCGQRVRA
jgi:hypothetical protein